MKPRARTYALLAALGTAAAVLAAGASSAWAEQAVEELEFKASDGVSLYATVSGEAPLRPRPLIVEYSPYGQGPGGPPAAPGFNYVQVHARGTGQSGGAWDIMGAREQLDVAESLRWFCARPWSSGRIGLYGFSASAIAAYYAMRRTSLPCVRTAALLAGTSSTYRDLIFIGGMPNLVPATVVSTAIGSAFLASLPGRFGNQPQSVIEAPGGARSATEAFTQHPTQDAFWREREFPGPNGPPDFPILAATGFYDVESRGPFETFKASRDQGSHLLVMGAHDGPAGGTEGVFPRFRRWFEHYLLGADNGIDFASRSSRARVRLVTTTVPAHRMRTVGTGERIARLLRRFSAARRIGPSLYRAHRRSSRLFGVRGGKVRFVAVAARRLIDNRKALGGDLRRAGLAR